MLSLNFDKYKLIELSRHLFILNKDLNSSFMDKNNLY